jgi:hypothetical protein
MQYLQRRIFKLQEKPPALQRKHPAPQNMTFIFLFFCGSLSLSCIQIWIQNTDNVSLFRMLTVYELELQGSSLKTTLLCGYSYLIFSYYGAAARTDEGDCPQQNTLWRRAAAEQADGEHVCLDAHV